MGRQKTRVLKWRKSNIEEPKPENQFSEEQGMNPFSLLPSVIMPMNVQTPFGLIPNADTFVFNCWLCSTNFDIDEEVVDIIEGVEGVELLNVFSPYTFRIIVGEQFDFADVRREIEEKVCGKTEKVVTSTKPSAKLLRSIKKLRLALSKESKYWAILVSPNCHIKSIKTDDINEKFNEDLVVFDELSRNIGALVEKSPSLV